MKKIYTINFIDINNVERKYIFTYSARSIKEIERKMECSVFSPDFGEKMLNIDMNKLSFLFYVGLIFAQPRLTEEEADEIFSYFTDEYGLDGAITLVSTMLTEFMGNNKDSKKKIVI